MKTKTNFYISIGNTRTTFGFFKGSVDNVNVVKRFTKDFFKVGDFKPILEELNIDPLEIFVCSVVKKVNEKITSFFVNKNVVFLTPDNQKIVGLDLLDDPNEIGNDIIAASIYANYLGRNVITISLGTATVISQVIDAKIVGCIILPGIEIAYNSLIEKTEVEKVGLIDTHKNIGTNTKDALSVGTLKGHRIAIHELCKNLGTKDTIHVYYGGNVSYIKFNEWINKNDIDLLGLYLFSINR